MDLRRGARSQRKLEKTGGYKKRGKKKPTYENSDRRGRDDCLSHASFLKLSRLFSQKMEGGGREVSTNPTFIYATCWERFQWEFLMLFHVP